LSLIEFIKNTTDKKKRKVYIFLLAFAVVLNIIENIIPKPVPWFRIGLTKIALIIVVYSFEFKYILLFPVLRAIVGFSITGLLFTPVFIWSLSGSIVSAVVMYIIVHTGLNKFFSIYGVSISGAVFHSLTQWLLIIYFFNLNFSVILPAVLGLAVISGLITAYIADAVIRYRDGGSF